MSLKLKGGQRWTSTQKGPSRSPTMRTQARDCQRTRDEHSASGIAWSLKAVSRQMCAPQCLAWCCSLLAVLSQSFQCPLDLRQVLHPSHRHHCSRYKRLRSLDCYVLSFSLSYAEIHEHRQVASSDHRWFWSLFSPSERHPLHQQVFRTDLCRGPWVCRLLSSPALGYPWLEQTQ